MKKVGYILLLILLSMSLAPLSVSAQCDVEGILLELQSTTTLSGLLIGKSGCVSSATVSSPLSYNSSTGTLSITAGSLAIVRDSSLFGWATTANPLGIRGYAAASNGQVPSKTTLGISWVTPLLSEVDGVIGNEGVLGVSAGTGTTSLITSNTPGAAGVTISAGIGIGISETTSPNGGTVVVTNNSPDQTVLLSGTGIVSITGTYPSFTITAPDKSLTISDGTNSETLGGQTLTVSGAGGNTAAYNPATNTLTITGTASTLPTGTDKQTLRFNGTTLEASSALTNDGGYIGVNADPLGTPIRFYVNGASRYDGSQIIKGAGSYVSTTTSPHFRLWNTTPTTGGTWYIASNDDGTFNIYSDALSQNIVNITTAGQFQVTNGLRIGSVSGTPTSIIGRNASGDVGSITIGSGLSFSGGSLSATGGTGTVTSVAATAPAAGFTISGSPITTFGTLTFALNADLAGVEGLATNGIATRTATNTWTTRTLTAGTGISITNGDGVSGNPTITSTVTSGVTQSTTLVDGRVTLSAGSNLVTDDGGFRFDRTNDFATIGTSGLTPQAALNIFPAATTGTLEGVRFAASTTGNMVNSLLNASNTGSANSINQISVGGTSAGDPIMQFTVVGTVTTAIGIDNSDAQKFKITPGAAVPGGTTNRGLVVTNAATSLVGVNIDAPAHPLDVSGRARANMFITPIGSNTVTLGSGAGSTATLLLSESGGNWHRVRFKPNGTIIANQAIFNISLATTSPSQKLIVVVKSGNSNTDDSKYYVDATTTNGNIAIFNKNGALVAGVDQEVYLIFFGG